LVARIVTDYAESTDPTREAAWIAEVDGQRAGCIFCVPGDQPDGAKLRVLLVTYHGRRRGLGLRLVQSCLAFARNADYRHLILWTDATLESVYNIHQFVLTSQAPHHSFGHDLLGEHWMLDLRNESTLY
jgi:N-acetylglutamate synthase-like GNAT family acetyltransferase